MAKKKKRRLNYKRIFMAFILLFIVLFLAITLIKNIFNSKFKVEVLDKYVVTNEEGIIDINFKATYKGKKVT